MDWRSNHHPRRCGDSGVLRIDPSPFPEVKEREGLAPLEAARDRSVLLPLTGLTLSLGKSNVEITKG